MFNHAYESQSGRCERNFLQSRFQAHAPRRTARARARIRSTRTIGSGGPTPGLRPRSPLPQPGLAIRAVGGRTSPAAGGLRNKPGGALPLCLSSCSWPLLLLRCHARILLLRGPVLWLGFSLSPPPKDPNLGSGFHPSDSRGDLATTLLALPIAFGCGIPLSLGVLSRRLGGHSVLGSSSLRCSSAWFGCAAAWFGACEVEASSPGERDGFRLSNPRFPVAFSLPPLLIPPRSNRFVDNYAGFRLFHSTRPGCFPLKAAPLPTNFW